MSKQLRNLVIAFTLVLIGVAGNAQNVITGKILDQNQEPIPGATVLIKNTTTGTLTADNGSYQLKSSQKGRFTLEASFMGFKTFSKAIELTGNTQLTLNITLEEATNALDEVTVTGKSVVQQVRDKAFNVSVVDTKKLSNTTLDLGHALDKVSGVRVRENGGVGSQMNFSINGFRGRQIKFFLDGIPMENFGSAFQLNNIPVNLANRIEVYKGVVPIGLGADALGGAVNIVTNSYTQNHLEASYSYGSFNTHRSTVNAIYVSDSGFTAQVNAFQNYSDNTYKVDVDVADINTGEYYPNQEVERFNDQYHNETAIINVGVVNKSYADQLLLGVTLGKSYQEIQTGARLVSVFGGWHRRANIVMPSLKYKKDDFIIKKLNARISANYNLGSEQNIDTLNRRYNWLGQFKEYEGAGGERSYSLYKYRNNNGIATASFDYKIDDHQTIALSNTFNTFNRKGEDEANPDNDRYDEPRKTMKNVLGLGYTYEQENWNASVFMKNFFQQNEFTASYNPTGNYGDVAYYNTINTFNHIGYGTALTYFLHKNLQFKASFEKTYRLPAANELFGDVINLQGNTDLKPEYSYNYNLGTSYWLTLKQDLINFNLNTFYRDASDFIRPELNQNQTMQVMGNLASVTNAGIESEIRYQHGKSFAAGLSVTYQELRNDTRFVGDQTVESIVYRDRIPNMPYLYGNADANYTFFNVLRKDDNFNIGYNLLYVHEFYLYWPSQGSEKLVIPEQLAHDVTLTYTLNKKLQFTLECRNITDRNLYDNFSLQKPGRAFFGKIKYTIL